MHTKFPAFNTKQRREQHSTTTKDLTTMAGRDHGKERSLELFTDSEYPEDNAGEAEPYTNNRLASNKALDKYLNTK